MTTGAPAVLPVALRAWAVPELPADEPWASSRTRADPELMLVFDTETRLEPEQALTFGIGRIYRHRLRITADDLDDWECIGEWLFYGEDLSAQEIEVLEAFAYRGPTVEYFGPFFSQRSERTIWRGHRLHVTPDGIPIVVLPRARFVRSVLWPVLRDGGMLVGFNLPFDIARVAEGWGTARPPRRRKERKPKAAKPWDAFAGGFSLPLLADQAGRPNRKGPRIVIHTIDSKRHLVALRGHAQTMYRGHFLDLRTLAFALTNRGHSLASAAEAFATAHRKMDHAPTGRVDDEELVYGRADVEATFDLAVKLLDEFGRHAVIGRSTGAIPIDLQPTKAFSPASIGKGYLRAWKRSLLQAQVAHPAHLAQSNRFTGSALAESVEDPRSWVFEEHGSARKIVETTPTLELVDRR